MNTSTLVLASYVVPFSRRSYPCYNVVPFSLKKKHRPIFVNILFTTFFFESKTNNLINFVSSLSCSTEGCYTTCYLNISLFKCEFFYPRPFNPRAKRVERLARVPMTFCNLTFKVFNVNFFKKYFYSLLCLWLVHLTHELYGAEADHK